MPKKISSGIAWPARGAAALAGFAVVLALVLVGALMMLAVLFGMLVLPPPEPSRTRPSGDPANSRRGWPGLLYPRPRPRS